MRNAVFGLFAKTIYNLILGLTLFGNMAYAHSQLSPQCSSLFELGPAANDDSDPIMLAAFSKNRSALYSGHLIQVRQLESLKLTFDPRFEVLEIELTQDGEYLIATGETEARIFHLGKVASTVFQSKISGKTQFYYDTETQILVMKSGRYLMAHDIVKQKQLMLSALPASVKDGPIFDIQYDFGAAGEGHFVIEVNDLEKGKRFGHFKAGSAQVKWKKAEAPF